jgi:hypothetical protein
MTLPGSLSNQKFWGKFEAKSLWFINIPDIKGFTENDPDICLFIVKIFFLFLKNDIATNNFLSQVRGYLHGIELYFFLTPFENTVTLPVLLRPDLFLKKNLKNLFGFTNFNRKDDFLNRCVGVVGLCTLVKI